MAKLKLSNTIKGKMAARFKARITLIGLSKTQDSIAESPTNYATALGFLCGGKELYDINYNPGNTLEVELSNSIANPPFLNFAVSNGETPYKYHLFHKDGSDYYRDVTINRSSPSSKEYDSAFFIKQLKINFKGNGE